MQAVRLGSTSARLLAGATVLLLVPSCEAVRRATLLSPSSTMYMYFNTLTSVFRACAHGRGIQPLLTIYITLSLIEESEDPIRGLS